MLGQRCLLPMGGYTGCCLFDVSDWKDGSTANITGPVATPCCAGKPKKSIVERLCGLKHADVSELVKLRQRCSKQLVRGPGYHGRSKPLHLWVGQHI